MWFFTRLVRGRRVEGMGGFFKFICASFARALGQMLAGLVMVSLGFTGQFIASWFGDETPWWVSLLDLWYVQLALIVCGFFLVAAVFYRQAKYMQSFGPSPDTSMKSAFEYMEHKSAQFHGRKKHKMTSGAAKFLRQTARENHITIFGRPETSPGKFSTANEPIKSDYWTGMKLSETLILAADKSKAQTEPEDLADPAAQEETRYTFLQVNQIQLENRFPRQNVIQWVSTGIRWAFTKLRSK